jgi:hypothetical protein
VWCKISITYYNVYYSIYMGSGLVNRVTDHSITSFDIIKQAAVKHGIEPEICRWISTMLESRTRTTTLSGEILGASASRGCPQGGVLSPLLWSLVVDDLLWGLNDDGYYTVGYADDIAILTQGKFLTTVSECLQTALYTVQRWYERRGLSINPN